MRKIKHERYEEIKENPGRGGCGILAVAELHDPASHELLQTALTGLERMEHRGGTLEDTGDGAGLLIRVERSYFERFLAAGKSLANPKEPLMVGTVFFLHGERNIPDYKHELDAILRNEGLAPLGWRKVPTEPQALGIRSQSDVPQIYQLLLAKGYRRESQLFEVLHQAKVTIDEQFSGMVNVVSLEAYTTIYKALSTSSQLAAFYPDLRDPALATRLAIGHRRYSTNTYSNWNLVQPFRHLAHNGEINTITANCRAVRDAERSINLRNILMNHGSDSAQMDRVAEMMAAYGVSGVPEALRRMMPPAWEEEVLDERQRRFFEANRRALGTLGAWEGPIALVATDGRFMVAALDRMGLRPLRYMQSKQGRLVVASEIGAVDMAGQDIAMDGQLEPGGMIVVDLEKGTFIDQNRSTDWMLDRTGLNYERLSSVDLQPLYDDTVATPLSIRTLNAFGWTKERVRLLKDMAKGAKEPIYSMGNDQPLAIFSENHSRLYSFLHQIVAVVSNPPIDPIREGGAIDTTVYLGPSPRLTRDSTYHSSPQYKLTHPVLTNDEVERLLLQPASETAARRLDATFIDTGKAREMVRRIHDLTEEALGIVQRREATILVLSDLAAATGERLPLPMLLATCAIHRALAERGNRRRVSIVVQTGEVHEGHDFATLLAFGATAVNPYAMFHIARDVNSLDDSEAEANIVKALVDSLRRVMSKMGITMIAGYRGSALFEAVGISAGVVDFFLPDTICRLGGIRMEEIYEGIVERAGSSEEKLERNRNVAVYRKEVTDCLQLVARNGNEQGDYDRFVTLLQDAPPVYLRDLLDLRSRNRPLPVEEVAEVEEIVATTIRGAAMSHGALNSTAHRAIAAAFNRFGSRSSSGEGGEDGRRNPGGPWESAQSRIRQIASGRFGVDARYLVCSNEIEIKIGQGAKPGEGGHLPGHKVTEQIARIRKTKPGIDLISPPPHHDIYSIEDLAQLVTNLRELHPTAQVSIKVPSISNLGTIGVGIAKTGADIIVVSGFEGGTGAATSSSITHAGLPLERGVSEVHQYLVVNGIREKLRIRADGGIKHGLEAAKILALGADEVSIGTPLLVAECCIFCRGCNKGNCPVGIATQDESKQSQRFMRNRLEQRDMESVPEDERYEEATNGVTRYLQCMGNHLRRILARLGLRHPSELVGRVDLLQQIGTDNPRWDLLDLSELLLDFREDDRSLQRTKGVAKYAVSAINKRIVEEATEVLSGQAERVSIPLVLENRNHAVGATLAGRIAGVNGLRKGKRIEILARGYAGQAFGFAATSGMYLRLEGYANDTVGEIISGDARIVVLPPEESLRDVRSNLVGNAVAYGATGGCLYVAGCAGQRFGVRNSGAVLVCEGVGKYAFEYMTGGVGVVLGSCGPCVGSGMTGGELFLYDAEKQVSNQLHRDVSLCGDSLQPADTARLKTILEDFVAETQSRVALGILQNWEQSLLDFRRVLAAKGLN